MVSSGRKLAAEVVPALTSQVHHSAWKECSGRGLRFEFLQIPWIRGPQSIEDKTGPGGGKLTRNPLPGRLVEWPVPLWMRELS